MPPGVSFRAVQTVHHEKKLIARVRRVGGASFATS
jgi:hypothetical protein